MLGKKFFAVFLFSVPLFLIGCSSNFEKKAIEQKPYKFAVSTNIQSLDSKYAIDPTSQFVLNNVMEGLYKLDAKGEVIPAGAEEFPVITNDGLKYTIPLRKGAVWNDGSPVLAEDYVYSWQRNVIEKDSPNIGFFMNIKNVEDILADKSDSDKLGVYAADKYTLVVNLSTPTPYFTSMLINTAFLPQKRNFIEKSGNNYGSSSDELLYNGPYVLKSLKSVGISEKWVLEKNPKYWDNGVVSLNEVDMNVVKDIGTGVSLFESNELDDVPLAGEYAKQNISSDAFVSEKSDSALYLDLNHKNLQLSNIHLRKALSYSINRKALVTNVISNGSTALSSVLTNSLKLSNEESSGNTYDLSKAKKELEIAKSELKRENFTLDILTNDQELGMKASEYLQGQFSSLPGVKINIVPVPVNTQFDRLSKKDFDMSISGVSADYPDTFSILSNFMKDSPSNYGSYYSNRYDELLIASQKELDNKSRIKLLTSAEETINNDVAAIPLLQLNNARLRNVNVTGIRINSVGPKYDFKYLKWK